MSPTRSLVDTDELAERLAGDRPPVVVDVRWRLGDPPSEFAYLESHVPGAVWADLEVDLASAPGPGGRHPLPDPLRLQQALRRWGIDDGVPVVLYDASDSTAAARAWWVMRWAGVSGARVLDGGFTAWVRAGLPVESGAQARRQGSATVRPGGMPALDAADAAALAATGILLDARAPERFRGEMELVDPIAGHIPGARSAPAAGNTGPDGRFLSPDLLAQRFSTWTAGRTDAPIGAYCGSGVVAAQTVLALDQLGVQAALYVGSWSEWITDPSRPVARGVQ